MDELGIGLDKQELKNLVKHFLTIDFMDPALEEKILELENRLSEFGEIDDPADLTSDQINEFVGIYHEMMDLFNLEVKFYLVKGMKKFSFQNKI